MSESQGLPTTSQPLNTTGWRDKGGIPYQLQQADDDDRLVQNRGQPPNDVHDFHLP
jgi:hypothetical protein